MKRRILALAAAGCLVLGMATGCSKSILSGALAADEDATQAEPTQLISSSGSAATPEAEETAMPVDTSAANAAAEALAVEPSEDASPAPAVTLPQLNFGEGYMPAHSIDGIDVMNDKVVCLTFDDGPHPQNTPKLLDVLKENDVHATFFMVGENVASNPEIVKRAYEEGNEIGTHSWDHSKNDLKWSHEEVVDQIGRANDAIQQATGLKTIIDRPPEGAINQEVADGIGRIQILWDVDPNDWKPANRDPDIVYANVVESPEMHDGALVLSHDIRETTVDAYDRIIKALKEKGYKFVTVTQLIQIAQARGKDITYIFNGSPSAEAGAAAAAAGTPAPAEASAEGESAPQAAEPVADEADENGTEAVEAAGTLVG